MHRNQKSASSILATAHMIHAQNSYTKWHLKMGDNDKQIMQKMGSFLHNFSHRKR